ncbi:MAG: sulfite exporter TauE/SafE family protein [Alcanivoracaceae bacterium]
MSLTEALGAATLLALAGAGHCLGMCGGISLGLSMAVPEERRRGQKLWLWQALFALGRVSTYTLLGALAGGMGQWLINTLPAAGPVAWLLSALLMLMLGLMLLGKDIGLGKLERLGLHVWRRIQPLTLPLVPIRHPGQALLLGGLWGFLPCGLLYTALALSVSSGQAVHGAVIMLVFGLVTVPAVAAGGVATGLLTILRRQGWRRLTATLTLLMAGWLFWQGLAGAHGHHGASHTPQTGTDSELHHHHH